jgi:AcrR family transcriptional regulator
VAGTDSERLRQRVVRAAVPLLGEHDSLTTARIAEAAGVGEGELLAVFPDTTAVLDACVSTMTARVSAVIDPAGEVRRIAAVGVDQPLAARLVAVLDILVAYHRRVRDELSTFDQISAPGTGSGGGPGLRFLQGVPEVRESVVDLLRPDEDRLRLPVETLAEVFLLMSHAATRGAAEGPPPVPAEQIVDLFLDGCSA